MATVLPPGQLPPEPGGVTDAGLDATASTWSGATRAVIDPSTYLRRPTASQRARSVARVVTPVGWLAIVLCITSWLVGWRLGWDEFLYLAVVTGACLLAAAVQVIGRTTVEVDVEVHPERVMVGARSAAQVTVVNRGRRSFPSRMELVVGDGAAEFAVPSLSGDAVHEELFTLPTRRRAVIPVGPATVVRGDPLGLLRRAVRTTEPIPLIVHPRIAALGPLASGLLRDLEGQTTPDLSPADVAFHALRDYQPGDDRRFIHWLTVARVNRLMVRQFNDTRRAHAVLVMDGRLSAYPTEDDFETAVSVVGSIGVRALADEQDVTVSIGGRRLPAFSSRMLLDGLASVKPTKRVSLLRQAEHLERTGTDISLVVTVTGADTPIADLRAVTMRFDPAVRTLAVRVGGDAPTGFRRAGSTTVVNLRHLDDLARVLWVVTQL